jgi:hypothetical protein
MSARWYPVKKISNPQLLSASPTSIITVITSSWALDLLKPTIRNFK